MSEPTQQEPMLDETKAKAPDAPGEPLSDERLEEIRTRREDPRFDGDTDALFTFLCEDNDALLAEVVRLREENARLTAALQQIADLERLPVAEYENQLERNGLIEVERMERNIESLILTPEGADRVKEIQKR